MYELKEPTMTSPFNYPDHICVEIEPNDSLNQVADNSGHFMHCQSERDDVSYDTVDGYVATPCANEGSVHANLSSHVLNNGSPAVLPQSTWSTEGLFIGRGEHQSSLREDVAELIPTQDSFVWRDARGRTMVHNEGSLMSTHDSFVRPDAHGRTIAHDEGDVSTQNAFGRRDAQGRTIATAREVWLRRMRSPCTADRDARS